MGETKVSLTQLPHPTSSQLFDRALDPEPDLLVYSAGERDCHCHVIVGVGIYPADDRVQIWILKTFFSRGGARQVQHGAKLISKKI